jgi:thiamine pyrophosphate-dependent acetolactate synthase large subunit-like protein
VVRPAIQAAFASNRPALVEAVVEAEEKPFKPDELKA